MLNGLPEIVIVLFGPIIVNIILAIILCIDNLYLIYLWFANMSWFFKTNTNDSGTGKPKWDDVSFSSPVNYGCAIGLILVFSAILILSLIFALSLPITISTFLIMSYCVLSCVTYKGEMLGKSVNVLPIIKDVFKYYKTIIMGIFSFFVITSAFSKLGTIQGIISIISLALIYFGIISIDLFNPISKDHLTSLVSYNQAKKTCSFKESTKKTEEQGFLYNLLHGQKGGNITKELKEIGKKLSNKVSK
jgi:hypothetical protein